MDVFVARDVTIGRRYLRGPGLRVLTVALAAPAAIAFGVFALGGAEDPYFPLAAAVVLLEGVLFFLSPALLPDGAFGDARVTLRIDAAGLYADGRRLVAHGEVHDVALERSVDGTARVLLLGPRAATRLALTVEGARAPSVLAALERIVVPGALSFAVERAPLLDGAARAKEAALRAMGALALLAAVVSAMRALACDALLVAYPPLLVALAACVQRVRGRASVTVGAEGVAVRIGRHLRVVEHAEVVSVEARPSGARLHLRSARPVTLDVAGADDDASVRRDALLSRLTDARAHHAAAEHDRAAEALFARGDRALTAWLADVCALTRRAAPEAHRPSAYREIALSRERLWHVVEDPSADRTARAGAAVALADALGPAERLRLRSLAAATVDPAIASVLRAAGAGRAELIAALAGMDARHARDARPARDR